MGKIVSRLRIIRAERNIKSMREIAEATGISPSTLYNFENAQTKRLDFRILALLCEHLECQPGDLLEYRSRE
ncbi:MAG: helix-turn-helix transcriptional regulator [Chloroflexi bacterium]|nr:helix-turn-helix transcriptional regulator [Chloroflexota bacterium]MBU1751359.1 helix-turn-helix transcriptional regulator [Chloroflexota bacterium]